MRFRIVPLAAVALSLAVVAPAGAAGGKLVSAGSPMGPFSQNKQNEPAIAVDPMHPNVLAAGANDNIDMEACNSGADNTCPFTDGVGVSGIYFSTNGGGDWGQPTYTGYSARNCLGSVGDDAGCTPESQGPIGTLPWYTEHGLVSDGDPALAFGPAYVNGHFTWDASRLYYANLTSAFPGGAFNGAEAIAVSTTDNATAAAAGDKNAWSQPVIASKQNGGRFSDKEQIWADNFQSSPYFGNAYVCYAAFQGNGNGTTSQSLHVITSRDGGATWTDKSVTSSSVAGSGPHGNGSSGCTVRTDTGGIVYVFATQFSAGMPAPMQIFMVKSTNGGATWSRPVTVQRGYDTCVALEIAIGRCVEDGVGGARDDLGPAPSVDIANGAPNGTDGTDRIVLSWVDGRDGLNHEHVMFTWSDDQGKNWAPVEEVEQPGDRGYYSAPAISPDGKRVWLVYNAFTAPFRTDTRGPGNARPLDGVMLSATSDKSGVGTFSEVDRGGGGDARGSSQNNLGAEFLGDYVYAAATRTFGAAVWNDVRDAADCPAMDQYRWDLHQYATQLGRPVADPEEPRGAEDGRDRDKPSDGGQQAPTKPNVQQVCPFNFGNSSIYGDVYPNP